MLRFLKYQNEEEDTVSVAEEQYKAIDDGSDSFSVKNGLVYLDDTMDADAEGMEVVDHHFEEDSITTTSASPPPKQASPGWLPRYAKYFHRLLGITLVGLAWYACTSGIILQADNYPQDDQQRLMSVFWGVTGSIAGFSFLGGFVLRQE